MRVPLIVVALFCTGCASTGATPRPGPRPGARPAETISASLPNGGVAPTTPPAARAGGYEISGTALALRGAPYRLGGDDPNGFDCSGLVRYVFAQHGIALPRTVVEQFRVGSGVNATDLKAGDLVFFSTTTPGASHVGIAVGGGAFIHAPTSSGVVRVENLGSSYWGPRFLGARRVSS